MTEKERKQYMEAFGKRVKAYREALGMTQGELAAPEGFTVTIKNVKVSAGAGFVVVLTGDIMTMPGLPKAPSALKIDVDENGKITGLF